jgi:acyl transferase domain-containing protein/NADPH:quinone reductase-like Zn-dependent oxidoreductase/NADP-dependent 3-hydroxy acid dehydrogenase YdfG/acyl carrier protein
MTSPNTSHQLSAMHMLSPEGISHTFDDRANGYGRGDGIGALIVKRLSDAIRDGDTIRAVIRGTGVNADGKTPSVTQPSSEAQADLIIQTYEDAGLDQSDTEYFECHGTGTPVGDPIELTAIANTIGAARRAAGRSPLPIGSIKPTVGHTEGCAGLAGIFKAILLMEKGILTPTYGVERVNPKLKLSEWHLTLPEQPTQWKTPGVRRISVNSFGFGGANAHAILDDASHYLRQRNLTGKHNTITNGSISHNDTLKTLTNENISSEPQRLFLFSGRDQPGAKRVYEGVNAWLRTTFEQKQAPDILDNLAYTLGQRRTHLEHRTFAIASSLSELTDGLSKGLPGAARAQRQGNNIIMVFTGQGAQWPAMGREMFSNPIFHQSIGVSNAYLKALGCRWDAVEELAKVPNPNMDLPEYSQPLCTVIQIALVEVLRAWRILPTATIGHSSGEIAAAYAASLLTHRDALKLAFVRGLSSASVTKQGAMLAAGLSQEEAQAYLEDVPHGSVVVACVNSPSSVTLSGDVSVLDQLQTLISNDGKLARKLKVSTAYHSPHMSEVSASYLAQIGDISPKQTNEMESCPVMYSSLTASVVNSSKELSAQYWVRNMENPVQFSQALLALLKHKRVAPGGTRPVPIQWGALLEVGPHAALQGPIRQIIDLSNNRFAKSAPYTSMLVRGKDAIQTSLSTAGTLWAAGCKVDMAAINGHATDDRSPQILCDMPTYPWNHTKSFWHESYTSRSIRFPKHTRNDFLGIEEDSQNSYEPRWRNYLRISENPWIEDHKITGTVLYPASGMLVMALEGVLRTAASSKKVKGFHMTNVMFERGLMISLDDTPPVETRLCFHPCNLQHESWNFTVYSTAKGSPWMKHCTGTVALVYEREANEVEDCGVDITWQRQSDFRESLLQETDCVHVNVDHFYQRLDYIGMHYGPTFRNTVSVAAVPSRSASFGSVIVPDTRSTMPKKYESPHVIHPATLDSVFHLTLAALSTDGLAKEAVVPYSIEEIYIARDQPKEPATIYSGYNRLLSRDEHEIINEIVVSDQLWSSPKITMKNFALRTVTSRDGSMDADTTINTTSTKTCAEITWVADSAFLTSSQGITRLMSPANQATSVDLWLDSIFLNDPDTAVLIIMFNESESTLDMLRRLKDRQYGPRDITALATSESRCQMMRATLGEGADSKAITYTWLPEKELLETLVPQANSFIVALGVPDIATNAATLARLAPLALMTHFVQSDEIEIPLPHDTCAARLRTDSSPILLAATARCPPVELPSSVMLLLPTSPSEPLQTLATTIASKLEGLDISVTRSELTAIDAASLSGRFAISLLEVDSPLTYAWNEEQFGVFKELISTIGHLFWVTHGSVLESWSNGIEFATSQGLFRVLRNEYPMATLPSLNLSATADISTATYADLIISVWRSSLAETADMEYAEEGELVYVPRATESPGFDYELELENNTARPILTPLSALENPLKASTSVSGHDCIWIPDESALSALQTDEVEVKIEYAGVGGDGTLNHVHHAVGVVSRRGNSVERFQLGQRVIVLSKATARTHVRKDQAQMTLLPDQLRPQDAVALVEPLITAQYVLVEVSRLSHDQSLLLDNAASPLGQALIQVAKAKGADIYALVHTRSERDLLAQKFGIPREHIFDSAANNFVPTIESATQTRGGVDVVVIQQSSGAHVHKAMALLGSFGRFVDILNGNSSRQKLPIPTDNVTLTRVNMDAVLRDRPAMVSTLFQQAFRECDLQGPSNLAVLPATDLSTVPQSVHTEQLVLSLNDTTPVLTPAPPSQRLQLDSAATYVLVGGLGALGFDIAQWMIEYGAKHIVFLSRSGVSNSKDKLVRLQAERSIRAEAFQCDINDSVSVARIFDMLKARGKRIAGVIQSAMVLQDGIFENMSFDRWCAAIEPKTKGSRNLLANIGPADDNPFFILLSSITGIMGNPGQANYAAGNTFEDALAHHARTHLGINATSIDVGAVTDSSRFTNTGDGDSVRSRTPHHHLRDLQTTLKDLGVVMRAIMRGSTTSGHRAPAQIVLGLSDRIEHNDTVGGFSRDKKFTLRVVDNVKNDAGGDDQTKQDIGTMLTNATSLRDAETAVEDHLKEVIAATMGVAISEIDAQKPLFDYGVDSLQAVELRNRVQKFMQSDISVFDILSAVPLVGIVGKIVANSKMVNVFASDD